MPYAAAEGDGRGRTRSSAAPTSSLVVGANDVVNPDARNNPGSPIYGMPILNVDQAQSGRRAQAEHEPRLRRHREPALLQPEDGDAVRRREGVDREADRGRQGRSEWFRSSRAATSRRPSRRERALEAVRDAFVAYARGEWTMPPKVYVPAYPAGDFRAMPALGGGYAALKWVTSFPGNPARGLPTVTGLVLLSDASDGSLVAMLRRRRGDGAADRRCGRARGARHSGGRGTAAVIGAGVNGRAAARTFVARGSAVLLWDVDESRARAAADELGAAVAGSREEALAADVVVTVTPGHEVLFGRWLAAAGAARQPDGRRRAGQGGDRGRGARRARTSSATTGSRQATTASSSTRSRQDRLRATT